MNIIEYEKPDLPEYELEIWQRGFCPSLGKIHVMNNHIIFDYADLCSVDGKMKSDSLKEKISLLRKIVEGKIRANDYLIPDESLSLEDGKMWLKGTRIQFLPGKAEGDFFDRLCSYCANTDEKLAARLREENEKGAFSSQSLLRILSTWELEL